MPKSKSIHFFATKRDLEVLLSAIDSVRRLKYTEAGMFEEPEAISFSSGLELPKLGFAPSGDTNHEPFWLVTDADAAIEVNSVPQRRGGIRYCIDSEFNPESIVLWPGGMYKDSCVIAGQVGTAMLNPVSLELANLFASEIRRQFTRIKSFYVGPEAEQLLDSGYRLTHGITTVRSSDLSRS